MRKEVLSIQYQCDMCGDTIDCGITMRAGLGSSHKGYKKITGDLTENEGGPHICFGCVDKIVKFVQS